MKKVILLTMLGWLSACTQAANTANEAYDSTRAGVYNTAAKVQEWMQYDPAPTTPQAPHTRYCYKVLQDILCYRRPQPNTTARLIGYQGVAPVNMPPHLVNFGPIIDVDRNAHKGPFYVNHSPYKTDSGKTVTSSRVHVVEGEISVRDTMHDTPTTVSTSSKAVVPGRNPQRLMPSY